MVCACLHHTSRSLLAGDDSEFGRMAPTITIARPDSEPALNGIRLEAALQVVRRRAAEIAPAGQNALLQDGPDAQDQSLALALGCLGTLAPLVNLAKAMPAPPHTLVVLSSLASLGGFLVFFHHALRRGASTTLALSRRASRRVGRVGRGALRRVLEWLDIISCVGVSLVYAARTVPLALGAPFFAAFAVVWSVGLGGFLVFWKHDVRTRRRAARRVIVDSTIGVIEDGTHEMSADANDETLAEINPVDADKPELQQDPVKDILEHINLDQSPLVSSTPHKPRLNPLAPEFTPTSRVLPLIAIGNIMPDPSVRFPKAVPIMPPRRRIRARARLIAPDEE